MKNRLIVGVFALTGLIAWSAALGFGEDEPAKPMSEQEMWARSAELAKPGEMHKLIGYFCGKWKIKGKMFTGMGEMPFEGDVVDSWVLGERFVETKYEGPGMEGRMTGQGLLGYDNGKQEFQKTWAMSVGTGLSFTTGTYDKEKKTFTFTGKVLGPDNITYRTRSTIQIQGDDEYVTMSYATVDKDGAKEVKEMEMTFTRAKSDK